MNYILENDKDNELKLNLTYYNKYFFKEYFYNKIKEIILNEIWLIGSGASMSHNIMKRNVSMTM